MFYIAFTLGLFGSLHCLGMCGPLAFALLPGVEKGGLSNTIRVLNYNVGRLISYVSLGILAGITSSLLDITGLQKPLGVALGVLMIVLFFLSLDLEKLLFKSRYYRSTFNSYRKFLGRIMNRFHSLHPLVLGALNGLIPCGLVYLALAGSVTTGNVLESGLFMLYFGLSTFPAMIILLTGVSIIKLKRRLSIQRVFGYLQLLVGIFLILRAVTVDTPINLELYWSMGKLMCH